MRRVIAFFIGLIVLTGCIRQPGSEVVPTLAPATPTQLMATAPLMEETAMPSPRATMTPASVVAAPVWPPPVTPQAALARDGVTAAQQDSFEALAGAIPPERDDLALAMAYKGLAEAPAEAVFAGSPDVGSKEIFNILRHEDNTLHQVELTLRAIGDHAYFWFDEGPGAPRPSAAALAVVGDTFDEIYEESVAVFGSENNPGIDADPRIHIAHVSPLVLCDVSLATMGQCGLAGYFGTRDALPVAVDPTSNQREMFVMNAANFGTGHYLNVLAHEFRHMIEHHYDRNGADWEVEGSAALAEDLLGYPASAQRRANLFLEQPDRQLNHWSSDNPTPHYGQGYLFNRYLYDRLGAELYRRFAQHPLPGLASLDALADEHGLDVTGESLWLDWLVALAIHDQPGALERYEIDSEVNTAAATTVDDLPATFAETVHQYAADYYEMESEGAVTVRFTGSSLVPLLETVPPSGERMWWAQRGNYGRVSLTREFDLRAVNVATLRYAVYYDIEYGYDFAYVSVSTDGGRTWQGLSADGMQGLEPADNPAGNALTERFYTGRRQEWIEERIDLADYAGQMIQLRFEYVTDPILTYGGLALDEIAIPEIGFYDGAETEDAGWVAEGFSRLTPSIPQQWHLQVVIFTPGGPVVERVALSDDGTATFSLEPAGEEALLIVAASAPMTLAEGNYELSFER